MKEIWESQEPLTDLKEKITDLKGTLQFTDNVMEDKVEDKVKNLGKRFENI